MRRIILVQHGQSRHHVEPRIRIEQPDSENGLTDLGCRQAACVASRLHKELEGTPCRLYSSDQTRAWQTSRIIGRELDLAAMPVPEIREYASGRLAPPLPLTPEPRPGDRNWFLFDSRPEPFLETWREFHTRVCAGMDRLQREHPADEVAVVVGHGGSNSNIVTWWLRLPLDVLPERTPFAGRPGSLTLLRKNAYENPVVARLADVAHLMMDGVDGAGSLLS